MSIDLVSYNHIDKRKSILIMYSQFYQLYVEINNRSKSKELQLVRILWMNQSYLIEPDIVRNLGLVHLVEKALELLGKEIAEDMIQSVYEFGEKAIEGITKVLNSIQPDFVKLTTTVH